MNYLLVVKDGVDTLHQEHPWEECNTDAATRKEMVDEETADALVATGQAKRCDHCMAKQSVA